MIWRKRFLKSFGKRVRHIPSSNTWFIHSCPVIERFEVVESLQPFTFVTLHWMKSLAWCYPNGLSGNSVCWYSSSNAYRSSRYQYLTQRTVFVYLVFDIVFCESCVTIGKFNKLYFTRTSLSKSFVINSLRFARNDALRRRNQICQNPEFSTFELSENESRLNLTKLFN
jgi:hypothetical protein